MSTADKIVEALRPIAPGNKFTQPEVNLIDQLADMWDGRAAVPPPAPAKPPKKTKLKDEKKFFDSIRTSLFAGSLSEDQVNGMKDLLKVAGEAGWGNAFTANSHATSFLETNQTMQPVREAYWLSEDWRKNNLSYYPWYGRGLVQLTWEDNYKRADKELGLNGTMVAKPDRALEPPIASSVMVRGMAEGWFTGKKLADYLPSTGTGTKDQHKEARRIINGTDRWDDLANYAMKFQEALTAGGWG